MLKDLGLSKHDICIPLLITLVFHSLHIVDESQEFLLQITQGLQRSYFKKILSL